jgi:hypothetical protein
MRAMAKIRRPADMVLAKCRQRIQCEKGVNHDLVVKSVLPSVYVCRGGTRTVGQRNELC